MPVPSRRHIPVGGSAWPRAGHPYRQAGEAEDDRLGQRHGDDQHGHPQMVSGQILNDLSFRPPEVRLQAELVQQRISISVEKHHCLTLHVAQLSLHTPKPMAKT